MRRHALRLITASALCLWAHQASAGPLRERMAERVPALSEQDDLESHSQDASASKANLPGGVRTFKDQAYGLHPLQRFDVYAPRQARQAPVIFMVHGGAWRIGDKAHRSVVQNKARHWLARGAILVSVNYRLLPDATPLEQAADVALALAEAQKQAANWGGDSQRFVLMGHSAGAHLVGLLSAAPSMASKRGAQPWLGSVLLDSAALDVVKIMQTPRHYRFYDQAFGKDPASWASSSPWHVLEAGGRPMLLVCSSRRAESCDQARAFASKAASVKIKPSVLVQDMSHADINKQLGAPGRYTEAVDGFLASLPGFRPDASP